jgi:hypothetical protein
MPRTGGIILIGWMLGWLGESRRASRRYRCNPEKPARPPQSSRALVRHQFTRALAIALAIKQHDRYVPNRWCHARASSNFGAARSLATAHGSHSRAVVHGALKSVIGRDKLLGGTWFCISRLEAHSHFFDRFSQGVRQRSAARKARSASNEMFPLREAGTCCARNAGASEFSASRFAARARRANGGPVSASNAKSMARSTEHRGRRDSTTADAVRADTGWITDFANATGRPTR